MITSALIIVGLLLMAAPFSDGSYRARAVLDDDYLNTGGDQSKLPSESESDSVSIMVIAGVICLIGAAFRLELLG